MHFKYYLFLLLIVWILPHWVNGQAVKPRHAVLTLLSPQANWLVTPREGTLLTIKFAKKRVAFIQHQLAKTAAQKQSKLKNLQRKVRQVTQVPGKLLGKGAQKLENLQRKARQVTQVPGKLLGKGTQKVEQLRSKAQKVTEVPQKLTNTLQQKTRQKLAKVQEASKKLSRKLRKKLKKKLGKLQAAQKLTGDLETRTGGKLDQWTQKLTVPEMKQLKEAQQLLNNWGKKGQNLLPNHLSDHPIFKDLNQWTKLEGLKLDKLKDLPALQSLQKLQKLGSLDNLKGLQVLGKYGKQVQKLAAPYAEKFSLMRQLTRQYQGKFPGNRNASALAPKVQQFLAQHQDKLKAAQEQLALLKQRYQSIASLQNLDSSTLKRKSLEGQGSKRLILGGKFDIASYAPFSLDLTPRLGYRIDKNFSLGMTAGYRKTWGDLQNISLLPESFHYAGFLNYAILRSFYAYGEIGQAQTAPLTSKAQEENPPRWTRTFLVGVGKEVRLGKKMSLQTLLLYNFWHDPTQAVYPNPWVVRFGVQWNWKKP